MAYTKEQRRLIAHVFREAKKHLWDGRSPGPGPAYAMHICYAIERTHLRRGAREARSVIRDRLYPYDTVESWLRNQARVPDDYITAERVQAHRHAWLDLLIAEFEA